jgi:tetratricopeptide (TPR) repeat protein
MMRVPVGLLLVAIFASAHVYAADPLAEARRLYNVGQYENAARYAQEAMKMAATMDSARIVLGRVYLERFRRTAEAADLAHARNALKAVNTEALDHHERAELAIGFGECLFLEDKFGPASESFERAIDVSEALGPASHERVLDWWATALDRLALLRHRDGREAIYTRIVVRMEKELAMNPASAPAAYWLAAALRGSGHLDRAWYAAMAGWVAATLSRDHGAALRADLDRLMVQAIIPERAARLQPRDPKPATVGMLAEWEALKANWAR